MDGFLFARAGTLLRTSGTRTRFTDAATAATAIRSGAVPLLVGALPFDPAQEQATEKDIPADNVKPDYASDRVVHVLVAEDHDINQQLIADMLDRSGCRHALATNGREAVDMVTAAAAPGRHARLLGGGDEMVIVYGEGE